MAQTFDAFGLPDTSSGTWTGPFAYGGPYGYQSDPDSGLMLLGHRYYDASTGRFLSRDPASAGRNWYVYCRSQPTSNIDAEGLSAWHHLFRLVDGASETWKFSITKNPSTRYTRKFLEEKGLRMELITQYPQRWQALRDERVLVGEMPGPGNRDWWAGLRKPSLMSALCGFLKDVVETIDPTPISKGKDLGLMLGAIVDPWVEDLKRKRERNIMRWAEPD